MNKTLINKAEFGLIDGARRIVNSHVDNRFCSINFGSIGSIGSFGLSWKSDLIEPTILFLSNQIWIGIDQRLVCLSQETGCIVVSLVLMSNFSFFLSSKSIFIAICESDILMFNESLSLMEIINTPHIISNACVEKEMLIVNTLEGQTLSISTGR